MLDPKRVALFIPPEIIAQNKFKIKVFEAVGSKLGRVVRGKYDVMDKLPRDVIPIIGCTPWFRPVVAKWKAEKRDFIYWDRGYLRRVFATWLPKAPSRELSYYRWHLNSFQMENIDFDVPDDRWKALNIASELTPWKKSGKRIVVINVGPDYWNLHSELDWCEKTAQQLRQYTDRPIFIRDKESKVPLREELKDAHALVSHGSVAAVEAVVMGCPVFVAPGSAAQTMGCTDFSKIETPVYPEYELRQKWLHSLAYNQWNEHEMQDGTLWRMLG